MSKKGFGKLVTLAAIAGAAAAGISYLKKYQSFNKELDEEFHDFEDEDDTPIPDSTMNRNYVSLSANKDELIIAASDMLDAAKDVAGAAKNVLKDAAAIASETTKEAVKAAQERKEVLKNAAKDIKDDAEDIIEDIENDMEDTIDDVEDIIEDFMEDNNEEQELENADDFLNEEAAASANTGSPKVADESAFVETETAKPASTVITEEEL